MQGGRDGGEGMIMTCEMLGDVTYLKQTCVACRII